MLSAGRTTLPNSMSWGTTRLTVLMGMAKPTPAEVPVLVKMAVHTPITLPSAHTDGTPGSHTHLCCVTQQVAPLTHLSQEVAHHCCLHKCSNIQVKHQIGGNLMVAKPCRQVLLSPGLMAASVCRPPGITLPACDWISLPMPLSTPEVRV